MRLAESRAHKSTVIVSLPTLNTATCSEGQAKRETDISGKLAETLSKGSYPPRTFDIEVHIDKSMIEDSDARQPDGDFIDRDKYATPVTPRSPLDRVEDDHV